MKSPANETRRSDETLARSITKTLSYRAAILLLDFSAIYLFTRKIDIAVGFMIVSNLYTTIGYFAHERIWDRIKWGRRIVVPAEPEPAKAATP